MLEVRSPWESKRDAMDPQSSEVAGDSAPSQPASQTEDTAIRVIFFTDMKGSTALKQDMAEKWDEGTFQRVRQEPDSLPIEIITRDHAGQIVKSTGDGFLAIFNKPSTAVERAMEIQEKLRGHAHLRVRIGIDTGEVRVESVGGATRDVFGRHVDWAARAMAMADGGARPLAPGVHGRGGARAPGEDASIADHPVVGAGGARRAGLRREGRRD